MRSLIIAEKPELGRAIASAIDGPNKEVRGVINKQNVVITWAYGHLLRLCEPDEYDSKYKKWKKEDLPICFEDWKLVPDGNKRERVNQICELMKNCDQIIHAGDPDDEGQFLIDEILEYAHNTKPVKRVYINDNTPANIKKAFHHLLDNDEKLRALGRSAYARAVADYVVGINYSRLFSLLLKRKGLSVGRVQSPTLGLIVMRDEQVDSHIKTKYYELRVIGDVSEPKTSISLQLKPKSELLEDGKHIFHKEVLEEAQENMMKDVNKTLHIEEKLVESKPPLPFNLAKLQAHMNIKFGFDLSKTDQITQTLRDKYQAITYNRSDSQYLKEEHFQEANKVLCAVMEKLGQTYPLDYTIHSECFNEKYVSAHHAIIPTMSSFNIQALLPDERKVYEEIAKYYIMQFLPPIKKRQLSASVPSAYGELKATSMFVLDEGYKQYFKDQKEENEEEEETSKFDLPQGDYPICLHDSELVEKETNPPKRYTQASLIKDMTSIAKYVQDKEIKEILKKKDKDKKGENGSIGTSATRSTIVETLLKREYVEMKGKNIISTQLGKDFYHILPDEIKKPDLTAKWWLIQEDIKEGSADVQTLVDSVLLAFEPHLHKDYSHLKISGEEPIDDTRESIGICPVCGNKIVENSKGYGCVNYRNGCKYAIWKEDKFFKAINKEVSLPMAKKLLNDSYCLVKIMIDDKECIKIVQLGLRNGRAVYRLLDKT
ncbi:MAG: DNA topoisomerase [Longicatena sp.]